MESHTRGPWTTGPGTNGTVAVVARNESHPLIASVRSENRPTEETLANAELMAAAPELRKAAQVALSALYGAPEVGEVYDEGHADLQTRAIVTLLAALGMKPDFTPIKEPQRRKPFIIDYRSPESRADRD